MLSCLHFRFHAISSVISLFPLSFLAVTPSLGNSMTARELGHLLIQPHMRALLSAHDLVATKVWPTVLSEFLFFFVEYFVHFLFCMRHFDFIILSSMYYSLLYSSQGRSCKILKFPNINPTLQHGRDIKFGMEALAACLTQVLSRGPIS